MSDSSSIPDDDLARVRSFCAERSPEHLANQFRMDMAVRGRTVTIIDGQLVEGQWWDRAAARMKYDSSTNEWLLYWPDRNDKFHRYTDLPPGSIQPLLDEIDDDPFGIFWG